MEDHPEHPITHDGIFLGYDKNIPLKNEGLGRLLAFVISGWTRLPDRRLTIACPHWLVKDLQSLLSDHGVPADRYELLCTKESIWRRIQSRLKEFERRIRPRVHRVRSWIRGEMPPVEHDIRLSWIEKFFSIDMQRIANPKDWRTFVLDACKLLALIAIGLSGLIILWPLVVILVLAFVIYRLWRTVRKKAAESSASIHRQMRKQVQRKKRYTKELGKLIKQVNQQQSVKHWLVPTPFWPESNRLEHARVVVCPDLVLQQFPLRFSDPTTEPIYSRILETLQSTKRLICYSQFIKSHQLVRGVGLAAEQVEVIGHGRVELGEFLNLGKTTRDIEEKRQIALEFLRAFQRVSLTGNPYWNRFAWDKQRYVFYSSQARGQKNILSLLRAIAILRDRLSNPIRLVLTCERTAGSQIDSLISEYRLEPFVLFATGVSNQVLASLYCWAQAAVNPTLFEGGFPFTFSEAYSVGTPSLMSDIPMVRERVIDVELLEKMVFNPMDPRDIANKIQWGIEHREQLLGLQRNLYDSFPSWEDVAKRYSDAIRSCT